MIPTLSINLSMLQKYNTIALSKAIDTVKYEELSALESLENVGVERG